MLSPDLHTSLHGAHLQSLPCFCPSSAGRGQGWDSSLCTSLLSLLGTPRPWHCRVIGVHILRFYHLASHGNPPNPWEPACMRESPNTTNPSCFPSQCKYIMAGQDVIFPPCPTARCIRRGSSFISEKPGSPTRRAGTSWDLSYTGTGDTKDDYTSLLRDFGHGAELG